MHPVKSTNVLAVGYDTSTGTMRVQFQSGGVYDYANVSRNLYNAMLLPHPWRRLGPRIKSHLCTRIA